MNRSFALLAVASLAAWLSALPAVAQDTTTGLAAHYTFNTNGNDATANSRHLSTYGSPTHSGGRVGNAAHNLSASATYRLADASWIDGEASYTIAFWCRRSSHTRGASGPSVRLGPMYDGVTIRPFMDDWITTHNNHGSRDGAGVFIGGVCRVMVANKPPLDTWTLVALVVENSTSATLYCVVPADTTYTATTTSDLSLPASGCSLVIAEEVGETVEGIDLDELRIYTRALSSADVAALAAE